jgi:phosphate transport system substrate-binding protein
METTCKTTPGCIAYIGISYLSEALSDGLGYAALKNGYTGKGGARYTLPTPTNIASEVSSYQHIPTNATLSMINSTKAKTGYPIVNFEYAVVKPGAGGATRALLAWGMDPRHGAAHSYIDTVKFQALSPGAIKVALGLLAQV